MITIEAPGATLSVRLTTDRLDLGVERTPTTTPAGVLVIVGDGGWNPASLSLAFRVSSISSADAAAERNAALAIVTKATALTEGGRVTYVAGTLSTTVRLRGVWWEITAVFAPRALTAANEGTGEPVTLASAPVTIGGIPITVEV